MGRIPITWRLEKQYYRLIGQKCPMCNIKLFPPKRICPNCEYKFNAYIKHKYIFEDNTLNTEIGC